MRAKNHGDGTPSESRSAAAAGVIAVLDLPPGASLSVDGCAPRAIRRDDFVGVSDVPCSSSSSSDGTSGGTGVDGRGSVHLVVVRGAPAPSAAGRNADGDKGGDDDEEEEELERRRRDRAKGAPTPAVGFLISRGDSDDNLSSSKDDDGGGEGQGGWIFARRYDPRTEEPSAKPVDSLTSANLLRSVLGGGSLGPQRVVPYDRFMANGDEVDAVERWTNGTSFVGTKLIRKRGLRDGDKVVPGSYEDDNDDNGDGDEKKCADRINFADGITPAYPPVPCIDPDSSSPGRPAKRGVHAGTRRYLSSLSPSERTAAFLDSTPGSKVLRDVLKREYGGLWGDVLGDVQLSFVLFLHLGCLASFEHWRDLICMLSFVGDDAAGSLPNLYGNLIRILTDQLSSVEVDFFEEVEYSGENFLVPALERLCSLCSTSADSGVVGSVDALADAVSRRFNVRLSRSAADATAAASPGSKRKLRRTGTTPMDSDDDKRGNSSDDDCDAMEIDMQDGSEIDLTAASNDLRGSAGGSSDGSDPPQSSPGCRRPIAAALMETYENSDEEEDEPVVVTEEEVQASLARSSAEDARLAVMRTSAGSQAVGEGVEMSERGRNLIDVDENHRHQYPLLFAASIATGEDVLCCCARVLDEKADVSLVREAASYLEEVEAKR